MIITCIKKIITNYIASLYQGIKDYTGMVTFAKKPKLAKLLWQLKSIKKVHWCFLYVVTRSLLCFGCFVAGQLVNEMLFANIDVFFYWSDHWSIYRLAIACIVRTSTVVSCLCSA